MARILIVDADRFHIDQYADLLKQDGNDIDTAFSGETALEKIQQGAYQLVVVDLALADMSGLDILSRVKRLDPSIDVIMVTGDANVEPAIAALKNGARDYLIKPFNADEFRHSVSLCLEQHRLLDENEELKSLVSLFQASQAISNCLDLERLIPLVMDSLSKETGCMRGGGFFDCGDGRFELREVRGLDPEGLEAIATESVRRLLDDPERGVTVLPLELEGSPDVREALVLPIRTKTAMLGVALFCNNPGEDLPRIANRNRLSFLLDQSSLAFENAIRYANVRNMLYIDELTGLFNYRFLDVALEREIKRAERYGSRVAVLFLDLDYFKKVNDSHGHLVGSKVLGEVGALIKKSVREVDVVIRYGGDEFTVILSEVGSREAEIVAERIRSAIENHRFMLTEGYDIRLTASLGHAGFPEDARTKLELLQLADEAMYRGKTEGRNLSFAARRRIDGTPP